MRQVPVGWLLGWARRVALVPLLLAGALLLFGYQARMRLVDQKGSYCQHLDEHLWTTQAIRILKTGDLNPHRFTKPSVMVYLDTAGFALGLLKTGMKGTPVPALAELREGGYPYYTSPSMVRVARQIYALLSVAALGMVGLLARHLYRKMALAGPKAAQDAERLFITREDAAGLFAFGIGLLSEFYLRYSHLYLGVDILGCFFGILAIAYFVLAPPSTRPTTFAAVSGILAGLCLGTKYNLYPIACPALLAIAFRHRARMLSSSVLFFLTFGITFIVTTPYAILDLPHFVQSAVTEARHYSRGHGGHDANPGVSLFLAYGRPVLTAYGPGFVLLALVGAWVALRKAWKPTLLILGYPILLWLYMSSQRVIFTRNLLILQLVLPLFAALGAIEVLRGASAFAKDRGWTRAKHHVAVGLASVVPLLTVPWASVVQSHLGPVESRVELAAWLQEREEAKILIPKELEFDQRSLTNKELVEYNARDAGLAGLRRTHPGALIVAPVFEARGTGPRGKKSEVLWDAGKNRVLMARERFSGSYISDGNPKIVVY